MQTRRDFIKKTALTAIGSMLGPIGVQATGFDPKLLSSFADSLAGEVLLESDPKFERSRRVASFNPNTDKRPLLISRCRNSDDVARSIEFARTNHLELAVRSGGHDVMGQGVCEQGLLVDLSLMKQVEAHPDRNRVRVEAGLLAGELDQYLGESGRVVPLSCHPGVGVSGLTLGGGMGWLAGKYGTAADNVVSMDLVTADGRLLQVSREEHSELFWALRGGGGNFGIVTAIEYQTHPLQDVVGGFLVYPLEAMADFLDFYREFMANAPDELMLELAVAHIGKPLLVATACFTGDKKASDAALLPVRQFAKPLIEGIRKVKYPQLTVPTPEAINFINSESAKYPTPSSEPGDGYYNHWRGITISSWHGPAIKTFVNCLSDAPDGWSIGIGHYMHGLASSVGAGSTALPREDRSSSYFFNIGWRHSSQSTRYMAWVDRSVEAMAQHSSPATYINYLSSNSEQAVQTSYGSNYGRLQGLKRQHDPDNLFHLNRNIRA